MAKSPITYSAHDEKRSSWKSTVALCATAAACFGIHQCAQDEIVEPGVKLAPRSAQSSVTNIVQNNEGAQETSDMWGLAQLATNIADQTQEKIYARDRAYSANLDQHDCQKFWEVRLKYDAYLQQTDPVKRFEYLNDVDVRLRGYFTGNDDLTGDMSLRKEAAVALQFRIEQNPEDYLGNAQRYELLHRAWYGTEKHFNIYNVLDEQKSGRIKQSYGLLQNPAWPEPGTPESNRYYEAARELSRSDYHRSELKIIPIDEALNARIHKYLGQHYDAEEQRHKEFRLAKGAPCP